MRYIPVEVTWLPVAHITWLHIAGTMHLSHIVACKSCAVPYQHAVCVLQCYYTCTVPYGMRTAVLLM